MDQRHRAGNEMWAPTRAALHALVVSASLRTTRQLSGAQFATRPARRVARGCASGAGCRSARRICRPGEGDATRTQFDLVLLDDVPVATPPPDAMFRSVEGAGVDQPVWRSRVLDAGA